MQYDYDNPFDGNDPRDIMPGDIVKVFDRRLFEDDIKTPLNITMREATVIRRYGKPIKKYHEDLILGPYPDCIDVRFHRDGRISNGHFTRMVDLINATRSTT